METEVYPERRERFRKWSDFGLRAQLVADELLRPRLRKYFRFTRLLQRCMENWLSDQWRGGVSFTAFGTTQADNREVKLFTVGLAEAELRQYSLTEACLILFKRFYKATEALLDKFDEHPEMLEMLTELQGDG